MRVFLSICLLLASALVLSACGHESLPLFGSDEPVVEEAQDQVLQPAVAPEVTGPPAAQLPVE